MVFSAEDKAIIKYFYVEKGFTAYRIWKENPNKSWDKTSVKRLLKRFDKYETMDRKTGSGRPKTATTEENADEVEEMICSQEEPGTHVHPRDIAAEIGISHTSVRRILNERNIHQFKRVKTPQMNDGTRKRRTECASSLAERFSKKPSND